MALLAEVKLSQGELIRAREDCQLSNNNNNNDDCVWRNNIVAEWECSVVPEPGP